jgi:AraC-like DNA-binding protein
MNALLPQFLEVVVPWVMRHQWSPGQRYAAQPLEMHSLWLFLEGEAQITTDGQEWRIREGSAFVWPPHCRRDVVTPHGAQWISVCLRATLFRHIDLLQLLCPPVKWQPQGEDGQAFHNAMSALANEWGGVTPFTATAPDTMDEYLSQHFAQWPARDTTAALLCDAYAKSIVGLCWRMLGKIDLEQAASQNFPPWLSTALQRLHQEPDISIERLAREIGVSPTQFRRHFHKWFGSSPREYFNRVRLAEARQLLESSQLSVHEIAEHIGFLSTPHFNRLFKQVFGLPPAQYRQLSRLSISQSTPVASDDDRKS